MRNGVAVYTYSICEISSRGGFDPNRLEVKSDGSSGWPLRQRHRRPLRYFHIPGKTHRGIGVKLLVFAETTIITPIYNI